MGCFYCFPCCKSFKNSNIQFRDGEKNGCFGCKGSASLEEESIRGEEKTGRLCCHESSTTRRDCFFFCYKKSSKNDNKSRREGKEKKCCFTCFKSSGEERNGEKRSSCGIGCLCCGGESSSKGGPQKSRGCGYFSSMKSSKKDVESRGETRKGCFPCFMSSKEDRKETNRSSCRVACFQCRESSFKERGECCLSAKKSSSEEPKSESKDKKCLCCFRSSKAESSKKQKPGTYCDKTLSKERSIKERTSRSCLSYCCVGKSSKVNSLKKGVEIWPCFQCCKSSKASIHEERVQKGKSKEDLTKKRGRRVMCCCAFCCTKALDERKPRSKTKCTLSCFCCIQGSYQSSSVKKRKRGLSSLEITEKSQDENYKASPMNTTSFISDEILPLANGNKKVQVFTYKEIVAATKNFNEDFLLGSGGFGKVYKGEHLGKHEVVAVKCLKGNENNINNEFLVDVVTLSLLHHPNLIKLLGYCAERDQMILVYEYMPFGSLQNRLFDIAPNFKPLDWLTRMKIAVGAAKGLEHLHDIASPSMIYRDMKASNILLDEKYNPKLSDFGLEKPTRVMGTYGCCAPEYAFTRKLTKTTDVYSYGVLLLELITGKKAIDNTRQKTEQYLAHWAAPRFKDKRKFPKMADPLLNGKFPIKDLYQALAIANMCLQYEASSRPLMSDVVTAIEYLAKPETDSSENSEELQIHHQLHLSNKVKLDTPGNSRLRNSIASFDGETFQSMSSDIESCDTLIEEDEDE